MIYECEETTSATQQRDKIREEGGGMNLDKAVKVTRFGRYDEFDSFDND